MATPGDRCSKEKCVAYVEFIKMTESSLCLVSSTIPSPFLRLFSKPTAYSSFVTKNFDELMNLIFHCCYFGRLASQAYQSSPVKLYVQSTVSTDGLLGIHISLHLKGTTLRFSGTVVNKRIFFSIYIYVCIYIFIYFIYKCSKCPLGVHLFLSFQMMTKYLICSISPEKILVRE